MNKKSNAIKKFLGKIFFLTFILFFLNSFSFNLSNTSQNNSKVYFSKNNIKNFFFLKKNECFELKKIFFLKKEKIVINNNNFIGFFKEDRFQIFYIVKSKDTLYSIGKKSGHDYHELAKFNFIKEPNKIIIGQKIWIGDVLINNNIDNCSIINTENNTKKYFSCNVIFTTPLNISNFFNKNKKYSETPTKICFSCNKESKSKDDLLQQKSFIFSNHWSWPIKNIPIQYFFASKLEGNTNIEIVGFKGQPVFAAASGEVVCITDIFKKYGRLIIIRHDNNYFSVYAFNDSILVKQKEKVYQQQQIATMGLSPEKNIPRLYFDIFYKGESINPLNVLPRIKK